MSKADEIFEELGYKKEDRKNGYGSIWGVQYTNKKEDIEIIFDYTDKQVCTGALSNEPIYIDMQELQAINEKCKELGWI